MKKYLHPFEQVVLFSIAEIRMTRYWALQAFLKALKGEGVVISDLETQLKTCPCYSDTNLGRHQTETIM